MIRKLTYRFLIVIGSLIGMNFIYGYFFLEVDLQEHSPIINEVRSIPSNATILYVGESSNQMYAETDKDKRTISELLNYYTPNDVVGDITKPASHAGIYKTLLENVDASTPIKTAVITLNLRSFGAAWKHSELETPLQKSMVLLQTTPPLYNRLLLSFKEYDIKTKEERNEQMLKTWQTNALKFSEEKPFQTTSEWDYYIAMTGLMDSLGQKDQAKTELACHFVKGYAFHIDTVNDIRIKDFNEIITIAKERNWNLVFNLLAENMEKAEVLVGDDLTSMMRENRDILVEYFSKRGVVVMDNLEVVHDKHFIDQDWTTEHYDETGRKVIAKNLADLINSLK